MGRTGGRAPRAARLNDRGPAAPSPAALFGGGGDDPASRAPPDRDRGELDRRGALGAPLGAGLQRGARYRPADDNCAPMNRRFCCPVLFFLLFLAGCATAPRSTDQGA